MYKTSQTGCRASDLSKVLRLASLLPSSSVTLGIRLSYNFSFTLWISWSKTYRGSQHLRPSFGKFMCHDSSRNSLFHPSQEIPDGDGQDTTERNTNDKADRVEDVVMSHSRSYKIYICVVFFFLIQFRQKESSQQKVN